MNEPYNGRRTPTPEELAKEVAREREEQTSLTSILKDAFARQVERANAALDKLKVKHDDAEEHHAGPTR